MGFNYGRADRRAYARTSLFGREETVENTRKMRHVNSRAATSTQQDVFFGYDSTVRIQMPRRDRRIAPSPERHEALRCGCIIGFRFATSSSLRASLFLFGLGISQRLHSVSICFAIGPEETLS